jgi:hypothetical protein
VTMCARKAASIPSSQTVSAAATAHTGRNARSSLNTTIQTKAVRSCIRWLSTIRFPSAPTRWQGRVDTES